MRALLDVVAPVACVCCGGTADGDLCGVCANDVQIVAPPLCERCGAPLPVPASGCGDCRGLDGFVRARSLVAFAEPARALTLALKRRGRRPLARAIGDLLAELANVHGMCGPGPRTVTFVPAGLRARANGFDHAELIASAMAAALGLPLRRLVLRTTDGPRQADVPFSARAGNVRGRFAAKPSCGGVILVDDVYTTGATAEACSRALRGGGATSVDVLTWARTLRRRPRRD